MKAARDLRDKEEVGARLRGLREALGQSAKDFATSLGVAQNTWSQWETGKRMADLIAMSRVWEMTGATLDYIYLGRTDTLPLDLAQRLRAGMNQERPARSVSAAEK